MAHDFHTGHFTQDPHTKYADKTFYLIDSNGIVWASDLSYAQVMKAKEIVAGNQWSRTPMPELTPEAAEAAAIRARAAQTLADHKHLRTTYEAFKIPTGQSTDADAPSEPEAAVEVTAPAPAPVGDAAEIGDDGDAFDDDDLP